ncbi:MAG: hypothetical protein AAGA34_09770 [Pseudomonadota bacterium]
MSDSEDGPFDLIKKREKTEDKGSLVPLKNKNLVRFRTIIEGTPQVVYIPRSSLPELSRRLEKRVRNEARKAKLAEKFADRTFNLSLAVAGVFAAAGFGFVTAYGLTLGSVGLFVSSVAILAMGVRLSTKVDAIGADHRQEEQYAQQRLEGIKS